MKNADKFVVGGLVYDVLSPATFGDYMETIGSACINPDGYAENKLFLAYDDNVQKLFRATTAIANSELLIKDTNCEPTTMAEALANALSAGGVSYDNTDSGLTASNVQDAIDEVNGDVETVNSDLTNEVAVRAKLGAHNVFDLDGWLTSLGVNHSKSDEEYTIVIDSSAALNNPFVFSDTDIDCYISGTITTTTASNPRIEILNSSNQVVATINTSTSSASGRGCKVRLNWGTAGDFKVNEPMIRFDADPTYYPYAKTNRELTDDVIPAEITPTWGVNVNVYADTHFYKVGKVLYTFFQIAAKTDAIPANAWYTLAELPSGIRPKAQSRAIVLYDGTTPMPLLFTSDGLIRIYPKSQLAVGDQITGCCFTILK